MKYDDDGEALRFGSREELRRFHDELTSLVRTATVAASRGADVDEGVERARAVMRQHATVLRALNAMRRVLPRSADDGQRGGAPGDGAREGGGEGADGGVEHGGGVVGEGAGPDVEPA